ncbi:MAG: hypothetical protein ASARMPRED_006283 [Alectoria sarmentosa]|nr:MAG: hypothetical protein ASARMPRED_006283 [Alectoria sarmentosa]
MVLYQQTVFLILTLLFRLALSITPVNKSQDEELDGYVGYLPTSPTGDWLTATYCYCSQPHQGHQLQTRAADEGSFFQWEYYNYHQNATFIMHLLCERNHADDDDCPRKHCSLWKRPNALRKRKEDLWCMERDKSGTSHGITWNKQERSLTDEGMQDRIEGPDGDAPALCEEWCQAKVGMPMLTGDKNKNAKSHQEVFADLDDMCDSCRSPQTPWDLIDVSGTKVDPDPTPDSDPGQQYSAARISHSPSSDSSRLAIEKRPGTTTFGSYCTVCGIITIGIARKPAEQ